MGLNVNLTSAFIEDVRDGDPIVTLVTDASAQRQVLTGLAALRVRQSLREIRATFAQLQTKPTQPEADRGLS